MLGNRSVDDGETEPRRVGQLVRLKVYGAPAKQTADKWHNMIQRQKNETHPFLSTLTLALGEVALHPTAISVPA